MAELCSAKATGTQHAQYKQSTGTRTADGKDGAGLLCMSDSDQKHLFGITY
jgi:hypothetical protein